MTLALPYVAGVLGRGYGGWGEGAQCNDLVSKLLSNRLAVASRSQTQLNSYSNTSRSQTQLNSYSNTGVDRTHYAVWLASTNWPADLIG